MGSALALPKRNTTIGAVGSIADSIMVAPGVNSGRFPFGGVFRVLKSFGGRRASPRPFCIISRSKAE